MADKLTNQERRLLQVLTEESHYLSAESLAASLKVSRRSVYNYLNNVSRKLISVGIEPPRNINGSGYYLTSGSKLCVKDLLNVKDGGSDRLVHRVQFTDRRNILLLSLFAGEHDITISQLMNITGVARNTVISDLARIRKELNENQIDLVGTKEGHSLKGKELTIRNYFQVNFTDLMDGYDWIHKYQADNLLFEGKDTVGLNTMLNDWIHLVERQSERAFSDDAVRMIESYYAFVLKRILSGCFIPQDSFPSNLDDRRELRSKKEFGLASNLLAQVGVEVASHDAESLYLESLLMSGQLHSVGSDERDNVKTKVYKAAVEVVESFQQITGFSFYDRSQLTSELYVHLLSTYYRVKYHRQYRDGMVKAIEENYPDIYTYTELSIRPFEKLNNHPLNENELSLIAIYFGSQMYQDESRIGSALLVCSTGLGTSRMLKAQLESAFKGVKFVGPITKRNYNSMVQISESIVLSTIPLDKKNKEVLVLNPIMNDQEINELTKQLAVQGIVMPTLPSNKISALLDVISDNAEITNQTNLITGIKEVLSFSVKPYSKYERGYQPLLSELINENTIQFANASHLDWQQAITLATKPLLRSGSVEQSYIDAMIQNVYSNGPYINIGDRIAFAHARPEEGVNELGMAMLCLDNPIELLDDKHQIQLVFVLAASDDRSHLKALAELASMLGDKKRLKQLLNARKVSEVEAIIAEGEKQL
ncbi:BglG family transcription antiterminator [Lactiplantibacillus paraplantarum]|uniref:BglG family transcription antiterminator n=1 Tax=Lactiplantibacillus paraplantarum TaxID=60520 RepID=UPI003DA3EA11